MKHFKPHTEEEFLSRQDWLDIEKWIGSEEVGYDLCGSLAFCAFCDKSRKNPCARAESLWQTAQDDYLMREAVFEEIAAEEVPSGYERVLRYRRSFRSKLIQNAAVQESYSAIKNALLSCKEMRARTTQAGENFRARRKKLAKLCLGKKTLVLYLALDPAKYEESKYRFTDVSDRKTHAETPMKVRITSARALKHALELVEKLKETHGLTPKRDAEEKEYRFPYEEDETLLRKGLIKRYYVMLKTKR